MSSTGSTAAPRPARARSSPAHRQVHRVDPVRDPARTAHVLPLHPGSPLALLLLSLLFERPYRHPPPALPASHLVQTYHLIAPDLTYSCHLIPLHPVQQPLHPLRVRYHLLSTVHPFLYASLSPAHSDTSQPAATSASAQALPTSSIRADLSLTTHLDPILAAAATLYSFVSTNTYSDALPSSHRNFQPSLTH